MNLSLRIKLLIWFGVFIAVILVFSGIYIYRITEKAFYTDIDHTLKEAAIATKFLLEEKECEALVSDNEEQFWQDIHKKLPISMFYSQIIIADRNKRVIAKYVGDTGTALPIMSPDDILKYKSEENSKHFFFYSSGDFDDFRSISINGSEYRIISFDTRDYIINIAYDLQMINHSLSNISKLIIALVGLLMFVSIGGGYLLIKRALRPLKNIAETLNNFTVSRLNQRLPVPKSKGELQDLSSSLNEMIDRLEVSFGQLKQFSADAAHELKTPLTIIRGELEISLHEERSTEEYEAIIASALEEITRLSNVVETLLELSRADMGKVKMKKGKADLSRHIMDVCDDVVILSESKNVHVEYNIEPNIEIEYDSGRVHQAFLNVIDNAIKYTPEGGKIFINLKKNDSNAVIEVTDTGEGIPDSELPHIFDRFYRVKKKRSDEIQGTGLGLSIVKWIIEAHNGSIDVTSKRNQGTTFTMKLPLNSN